jgi:hypothetical protein
MDAMTVLQNEIVEVLRLTRGGDDAVPGFEGGSDESATETARTSSDEPNFGHKDEWCCLSGWTA